MSEPNATAFPIAIWTPQDFADTVRDASQHEAIRGTASVPVVDAEHATFTYPPIVPELMKPDPPACQHRAERVGMRPSSAKRTERLIVAIAVLLMVCSLGVAWLLVVVPA